MSDQILWQILGELAHANYFWRGRLKIKKGQDKFSWPSTPWAKKDDDSTSYGKVSAEDRPAAVSYLLSLSPKAKPPQKE